MVRCHVLSFCIMDEYCENNNRRKFGTSCTCSIIKQDKSFLHSCQFCDNSTTEPKQSEEDEIGRSTQSYGESGCENECFRPEISRNCASPGHCTCGRLHLSPTQHLVKVHTYHIVDSRVCECHQCLHEAIYTCCHDLNKFPCHQPHVVTDHDDVFMQRPRSVRRTDEQKRGKYHRKLSNDSGRLTLSESGDSSVSVDRSKPEAKNKQNQSAVMVSPLTSSAPLINSRRQRRHTAHSENDLNLLTASSNRLRIPSKKLPPLIFEDNKPTVFNCVKNRVTVGLSTRVELSSTIPSTEGEAINVYGICGSANGEIIATDADKVKIKTFGFNGELRNSYGTPTWPRYGRGITRTGNGGEFAVCHLTEVCVYSEDGKPTKRFKNEEFCCCWGIATDVYGNFAVTDSRSSCIFILNPQGNIIHKIGGKINDEQIKRKDKRKKNLNFGRKKIPQQSSESTTESTDVFPIQPLVEGISHIGKIMTPQFSRPSNRIRIISPRYVVFNSQGQILVTDTTQRCLLVFNADGSFAFMIGGGYQGCSMCGNRGSIIIGNSLPEILTTNVRESISTQSDTTPMKRTSWVNSKRYNRSQSANATDNFSESTGEMSWDDLKGSDSNNDSLRRGSLPASKGTFLSLLRNLKGKKKIRSANMRLKNYDVENTVGEKLRNHFEDSVNGSSIADSPRTARSSYGSSIEQSITSSQSMSTLWQRQGRRRNKTGDMPRAKSSDVIIENVSIDDEIHSDNLNISFAVPHSTDSKDEEFVGAFSQPQIASLNHKRHHLHSHKSISEPDNLHEHFERVNLSSSSNSSISDKPLRISSYSDKDLDDYSIITILKEEDENNYNLDENGEMSERAACRRCHVTDPRGVAVDASDNILLADASKHRISLFNPHGHFIRHLLTEADGLQEPKAICMLQNNKLAVTDASKKIKIYNLINGSAVK